MLSSLSSGPCFHYYHQSLAFITVIRALLSSLSSGPCFHYSHQGLAFITLIRALLSSLSLGPCCHHSSGPCFHHSSEPYFHRYHLLSSDKCFEILTLVLTEEPWVVRTICFLSDLHNKLTSQLQSEIDCLASLHIFQLLVSFTWQSWWKSTQCSPVKSSNLC